MLEELFELVGSGRWPAADGAVEVVPPGEATGGLEAVVEFTAHTVVVTDLPRDVVKAQRIDAFGAASAPGFLRWLAGPDGWLDSHDVLLVGAGTGPGTGRRLPEWPDDVDHPRIALARELRREVAAYGDERGVVTLGRGLGRRLEMSIELHDDVSPGTGAGGRLLADALCLLPAGRPVFASVAPGNARSLRCFLRRGFAPVGAEVLVRPGGR